jgi:4-amino-4-deoxy-L-arabinose transferase-like glycosyltransferase
VAATVGANNAAGYQLGTGDAVLAIGGFNGTDPAPTLAQFQQLVSQGRIHYFIAGGGFGGGASSSTSTAITTWVEQHFAARAVGGTTVYDLTAPG